MLRDLQGELGAVVADAIAARAPFTALRLEAAGRESPVMRRLAEALAAGVGLPEDAEDGDLRVRVRPDGGGWVVLVRTTRRPLSTRAWRACDRPGGLNASLAAAVPWLARPARGVAALNAFSGSGTLAIELALADPDARVDGLDVDPEAVACAERNASAAGVEGRVRFAVGDATALGAADGSVRLLLADPPWGDAVGAHAANRALYPAFLAEAARVVAPGGRLALVTHEVALVHDLLAGAAGAAWRTRPRAPRLARRPPPAAARRRAPGGRGRGPAEAGRGPRTALGAGANLNRMRALGRLKPGWYVLIALASLRRRRRASVGAATSSRCASCGWTSAGVEATAAPAALGPSEAAVPPPMPGDVGLWFPVPGARVPDDDDHLPGAPRPYRSGASEGFVFWPDGAACLGFGTPVIATGSGEIVRVDEPYAELDEAAWESLLAYVADGPTRASSTACAVARCGSSSTTAAWLATATSAACAPA